MSPRSWTPTASCSRRAGPARARGRRRPTPWPRRSRRCSPRAAALGVPLALEHTNSLRADVGFVHTLRDAIDLARALDIGVCMEINACWGERALGDTIAAGVDRIRLVQLSDYVIGTLTTPDRAVPGDGDIPFDRIVGQLLAAGYSGRVRPRAHRAPHRGRGLRDGGAARGGARSSCCSHASGPERWGS